MHEGPKTCMLIFLVIFLDIEGAANLFCRSLQFKKNLIQIQKKEQKPDLKCSIFGHFSIFWLDFAQTGGKQ